MTTPAALGTDPTWGLIDHLTLTVDGQWAPGPVDGHPVLLATYLEYLRRGGEPEDDAHQYRVWLLDRISGPQLDAVRRIGSELRRLTDAGRYDDLIGYLDREFAAVPEQPHHRQARKRTDAEQAALTRMETDPCSS